jgi:hypothetical protein
MELLASNTLKQRRSVLDAIEVLRQETTFSDHDHAKISVAPVTLPSKEDIGLLHLEFGCVMRGPVAVFLPASFEVRANFSSSATPRKVKISNLHDSIVDAQGHVLLIDEQEVYSVEIEVCNALREPTKLEWGIIFATLEVLGPKSKDYLKMPFAKCDSNVPEFIRTVESIDYVAIQRFQKNIEVAEDFFVAVRELLMKRFASRKPLSRQKFYDALFRFGMWIPKPQPRG